MKNSHPSAPNNAEEPIAAEKRSIDGSLSDSGKIQRELNSLVEKRKSDPGACAQFKGQVFVDIDFTSLSILDEFPQLLNGADFSNSSLINCRFGHDYMFGADAHDHFTHDGWASKKFCDLTGARFDQAILFGCSLAGANISRAHFGNAEIYHTNFCLAQAPDGLMSASVIFQNALIERCNFRGSSLDIDMRNARVIATNFGPLLTEPLDGKIRDERLSRTAKIQLRIVNSEYKRIIENAKHLVMSRLKGEDAKSSLWGEIFRPLERTNISNERQFHIAGIVGAKFSNARCDGANFADCNFGSCDFSQLAKFDNTLLHDVNFSAQPLEKSTIMAALREQILLSINAEIEPSKLQTLGRGALHRLVSQIASEIAWADEMVIVAESPGTEIPGGVAPANISGSSFFRAVIAESQFSDSIGQRIRLRNAYLLDSSISDAVWAGADLRNSIFYRVFGNRVTLDDATCDNTAFDGEFVEDDDIQFMADIARKFGEACEREGEISKRHLKKIRKIRKEFRTLRENLGYAHSDLIGAADGDSDNDLDVDEPPVLEDEYRFFLSRSKVTVAQKRDLARLHRFERKLRRRTYENIGTYFHDVSNDIEEQNTGADGLAEAYQVFPNACNLSLASFVNIKAKNGSVHFRACRLDGADFRRAEIGSGGGRTGVQFEMSTLRAARFDGADLQRANFSGATLTSIEGLSSAISLDGANFLNTHGLQGNEFRGANVTGVTLPLDLQSFGGILDTIEKLTRQARILFATLMFVCAYSVLTLATFEHTTSQAVDNAVIDEIQPQAGAQAAESATIDENTRERRGRDDGGEGMPGNAKDRPAPISSFGGLKLPVLSIEIPREYFFLATPLLIFSFYGMFQLKFARIVLEAQALPHTFPDGRLVDRHLFPWIFASLARIFLKPRKRLLTFGSQPQSPVAKSRLTEMMTVGIEQLLALIFGWAAVPVILVGFVIALNRTYLKEEIVMSLMDASFVREDVSMIVYILAVASALLPFLTTQLSTPLLKLKRSPVEPASAETNFIQRWALSVKRSALSLWAFITASLRRLLGTTATLATALTIAVLGNAVISGPEKMEQLSMMADDRFGATGDIVASAIDQLTKSLYSIELDNAYLIAIKNDQGENSQLNLIKTRTGEISGLDLTSQQVFGAEFQNVEFIHTNFSESTLIAVDFGHSHFENADFQNAQLFRTRLDQVEGLSAEQFQGACADAQTRLPADIPSLPRCE